jgi:hypothetical protein
MNPEKSAKTEQKPIPTPGQAIHSHCIDCIGGIYEVRECQGLKLFDAPCLLYPYRMGSGRPSVRLIRKYCLWCMSGQVQLVAHCPSKACPFLPYRMGKNPNVQCNPDRANRFKSGKTPAGRENFSSEST